jgi:peptidoglycan/xylan/chitin deacetylase (PgdA/CDA1 family)
MKMLNKMTLSAASGLLLGCSPLAQAGSADSVVVLQYHHVSDSTPAVTSIDPETFREHLQYLQDNNFNVIDITVARDAIEKGEELPEKAVVITFDDGYQNVYENAVKVLEDFEMPYTVFVNPELMRKHSGHYMGWEELKEIQQNGATIANHGQTHAHLIRKQEGESDEEWQERMRYDVIAAQEAIDENLGAQQKYFAYPYGEYNNELRALLDEWGFLAFAQHSGPWSKWSEDTVITRFPASGIYANLNTLKAKLNSKAMPVSAYQPEEPLVAHDNKRPTISVTLEAGDTLDDVRTDALQCFAGGSVLKPEWESDTKFRVSLEQDINIGRSRVNCTAPSASESRYYWYSVALIRPNESGSWPD